MRSRTWAASLLLVLSPLLVGCGDEPEPEVVPGPAAPAAPPLVYDPTLEPAAAVLVIVPESAEVLEVTDFEELRLQGGYGDLSSGSDAATLARFWQQVEQDAPLLRTPLLRQPDAGYAELGFTEADVSWEARFSGPDGDGYVVKFRDDLPMAGVRRAAERATGALAGATVVADAHVAALGATAEGSESWAADPDLRELVGEVGGSTYVARSCLSSATAFGADPAGLAPAPAEDLAALQDLGPFSVTFGGELATARLGEPRDDIFERVRLSETLASSGTELGSAFREPVGDPAGGRIGYTLGDAPAAAALTRDGQLAFAVCAPEQDPA